MVILQVSFRRDPSVRLHDVIKFAPGFSDCRRFERGLHSYLFLFDPFCTFRETTFGTVRIQLSQMNINHVYFSIFYINLCSTYTGDYLLTAHHACVAHRAAIYTGDSYSQLNIKQLYFALPYENMCITFFTVVSRVTVLALA